MDPSPSSPSPDVPAMESAEQGKLFVGGIPSDTREETLAEHFSGYGEVKEAVVMRDRMTGNCRGFGFVLFVDPAVSEIALKDERHIINDRPVEVKRALLRRHQTNALCREPSRISTNNSSYNGGESNPKKIFVGGLPETLTEEDFKRHFENFGRVTDTIVMYDNTTHRPRGFGFVTFDSEESVQNVLKSSSHELNGKSVDVKIAVPKDGTNHRSNGSHDNSARFSQSYDVRSRVFSGYQGGFYPPYGSRYGFPTATYAPYVYGPFGYYAYGYGGTFASSRYPWSIPYGSPHFFPGYPKGRLSNNVNMGFGGYDQGANFVNNQENRVPSADVASSLSEGVCLDA